LGAPLVLAGSTACRRMGWAVYALTGLLIFGAGHETLLETTVRGDKTDR